MTLPHCTISTSHSMTPSATPNAMGKAFLSLVGISDEAVYFALCRWQSAPLSVNASQRTYAVSSFFTVVAGTA